MNLFIVGTGYTFSCGATRIDVSYALSFILRYVLKSFSSSNIPSYAGSYNGDPFRLTYSAKAFPFALESPFNHVFIATISPSEALS